ncbi:hypothetical protein NE619_05500 [Anaerovorax odorimutans]|uniref:Secreted protein n=1 Tax=Anaerovorax odorimutans TaxID=109327 RepID=A0ABT1RLW6_9FIRM|nr:hypothetical protein [Anaerovorax odorimutans]
MKIAICLFLAVSHKAILAAKPYPTGNFSRFFQKVTHFSTILRPPKAPEAQTVIFYGSGHPQTHSFA